MRISNKARKEREAAQTQEQVNVPVKRKRRTKAQIASDEAAALAALSDVDLTGIDLKSEEE